MGSENKKKNTDGTVLYYDVAAGVSREGDAQKLASKYATKDTVNLCIRERKGISTELFFLILAAILVVLLLLEFFFAYRPYLNLEEKEKQRDAEQAAVDRLIDEMKDIDSVREEYRKYNYENFPRERVDREDVFALIEETVFPYAMITHFTFRDNVLTLALHGNDRADISLISDSILDHGDLVESCRRTAWTIDGEGEWVSTFTVTFKDAA